MMGQQRFVRRTNGAAKLGLSLVLLATMSGVPATALASSRTVTLEHVYGHVYVRKAGGYREFHAVNGMRVSRGDRIRTGDDGSVTMVYSQDTTTTVGSDSILTIQNLSSSNGASQNSIYLWFGDIWNRVKSLFNADDQFTVETPTAIMGVRGTEFGIEVGNQGDSATTAVFDGDVAVNSSQFLTPAPNTTQHVLLNQQLQTNAASSTQSSLQTLDVPSIVQTYDPVVLAQMIQDILPVAQQKQTDAQQALNQYEQSTDPSADRLSALEQALRLAKEGVGMSELGQKLITTLSQTSKYSAVNAFMPTGQDLSSYMQALESLLAQMQQTLSQTEQTAQEAGLSTDQINSIYDYTPVTGYLPPPPPPVVQAYTVSGTITNRITDGPPPANIHVELLDSSTNAVLKDTYTNSHGTYAFTQVPNGSYLVQLPDYDAPTLSVTVSGNNVPGEDLSVDIYPSPPA